MTDVLHLAMQAKRELPATEKAVQALEQSYKDQWANEKDPAAREALWSRVAALKEILPILVAAATEADIAEHEAAMKAQGF